MLVQQKADIASGTTVSLSGIGLWMHYANTWVSEYMPLITAFGIIGGFILSAWYYWQSIQQKRRDRELRWRELDNAKAQRDHDYWLKGDIDDKSP